MREPAPLQVRSVSSLVSVVIPCFNQAHFLSDAVESVLRQTHGFVEVTIVDDGSTDDTARVAARYPQAGYVYQKNSGLAAARNVGLHRSSGEFVVFLDADDRLLPDALRIGCEQFGKRPECAFVSGDHRYICTEGTVIAEWRRLPLTEDPYVELLKNNFIGMCGTVTYRRDVVLEVGGFDSTLSACEDYDLYLRIAQRLPVFAHNQLVAEYRRYGTAMSDDPARMLRAAITVLRRQWPAARRAGAVAALQYGLRHWRSYYGKPLARIARTHLVSKGSRTRGCREVVCLMRYAPEQLWSLFAPDTHAQARQRGDSPPLGR